MSTNQLLPEKPKTPPARFPFLNSLASLSYYWLSFIVVGIFSLLSMLLVAFQQCLAVVLKHPVIQPVKKLFLHLLKRLLVFLLVLYILGSLLKTLLLG